MSADPAAKLIPADSSAAAVLSASGTEHPDAAAAELLSRVHEEIPAMAGLPMREELLAAAWLMSLRSARTAAPTPAICGRGWPG
jgi:hypothetical protein